jgi:serine/threonine-protein kinase HipA
MISTLEVFDCSSDRDVLVGTARFTLRRGAVSTTFSYDEKYLQSQHAYALDPGLPLVLAPIHSAGLPGAFRDSAPDRWGRHLIQRSCADAARQENLPPRKLDEVDFLTGVFDQTREGSLRFREPAGEFLSTQAAIPSLVQLPRLAASSRDVAKDSAGKEEIKALLDAGSGSLGGARPKASVCDAGKLLIAKFSHPNDEWDVIAWEKTAFDMADDCGISVPASRLVRIGNESVLLLERFDREGSLMDGNRIPYMSAMAALQSEDGTSHDYAELSEEIVALSNAPDAQLKEMFSRVAFFIAVGNTDDHLRNWGFLRKTRSWELSPLFDVNPTPYENARRETSIVGHSGAQESVGLKELAAYAGLSSEEAAEIVGNILDVTMRWKDYARRNSCPEKELALFAPLFSQKAAQLKYAFDI